MPQSDHLEIIPLGGLGEFGMNFMVYRSGNDCLVVDAGIMFPGEEHLGVDVAIPDFSFLEDCGTIHGVLLTHGHEDHVGALPYLLARHDLPVYATPYTTGLVRAKLTEHPGVGRNALHALPDRGEALTLGPFGIEAIAAAHSIPQARMLALHTPHGVVVHTGDFKLDPNPPDGGATDIARLAELGREGVLALLSDSTNADVPGFSGGELEATRGLARWIGSARGRVVVTIFSSNICRLQQLARLAERYHRKLALVGSSIRAQADVAERLGLLQIPEHVRVAADSVMDLQPERVLIAATGTQGEPMSALARIAVEQHREVRLEPGDLVLHSARKIPGNEKSIGRMIDHLLRRGAEVVTADDAPIHVSGHPARDELSLLLQLVRPRYLVPIHGEYRQLLAHARLATDAGIPSGNVLLAESGDLIAVNDFGIGVEDHVQVGQVFIDAALEAVDSAILSERRRVAGEGIVVAVVALHRDGREPGEQPEIVTRGFVPGTESNGGTLMEEARSAVLEAIAEATPEERTDEALLKARIQRDLKRLLRRRTQRRPLIIPVLVEL